MDISTTTCFSLIEQLRPLFETYGEEQVVAALAVLLQQEHIAEHDDDPMLRDRYVDLVELHEKWAAQNEPLCNDEDDEEDDDA